MVSEGLPPAKLAHRVGVTAQHINNILGGRTQPRLDLCYEILDQLGVPPEKLSFYFPPNGMRVEATERPTASRIIRVGARVY